MTPAPLRETSEFSVSYDEQNLCRFPSHLAQELRAAKDQGGLPSQSEKSPGEQLHLILDPAENILLRTIAEIPVENVDDSVGYSVT